MNLHLVHTSNKKEKHRRNVSDGLFPALFYNEQRFKKREKADNPKPLTLRINVSLCTDLGMDLNVGPRFSPGGSNPRAKRKKGEK